MHKPDSELIVDKKNIGSNYPAYFIADIAANHDGDLSRAKDLIWKAKEAGADAAKFQHFKAETIVSDFGFRTLGNQKSHQSSWKKSVFEVYKEASVNLAWTQELKNTCDQAEITFFTSPYAFDVVDEIDEYVPAYKIGSGDITWTEIIDYIAKKGKPYILATGASTMEDVVRAVEVGLMVNPKLALLQCNTNYTGSVENMKHIQLNVLRVYRKMFPDMVLGLSDHTPGHATVLGAIALGGKIIEKHFTDDVSRTGPDHAFSMDPQSWREMILRSRELEASLGSGIKKIEENEKETVVLQRRAIRVNRVLKKGHLISRGDLEILRPCPSTAIPANKICEVIGKRLLTDMAKGDFLRPNSLIDE